MTFISNTTPTPNWLYNGEMKKMTGTELKVVLLVTRKTLGWFDPMTSKRKEQDYIGQKQFIEFTGQSNRAIATAIQVCVKVGWIIARDRNGNLCNTPEKRARRKIWYQLGNIFTDKISGEESSQEDKSGEHFSKSGEQNDTHLVKKVHSTKETLTKETIQKDDFNFSFDCFYSKYPKKVGRKTAHISWLKIKPDKNLFNKIISTLDIVKKSKQWNKEDGQFIPNPATWLNQERWNDEIVNKPKIITQ